MKTMKKFVAALLVLSMVLALAVTAMAACDIKADMWVSFKRDATAYSAAKSSKATKNVVKKCSVAWCDKICGKYARVIVNVQANTKCWFKIADLKEAKTFDTKVIWAKGGKGMSKCDGKLYSEPYFKGYYAKVTGHTNLRKNAGMKCKSQGVVEKGTMLKMTGRYGVDDRFVAWWEVCYKGKKVFVSENFLELEDDGFPATYKKK